MKFNFSPCLIFPTTAHPDDGFVHTICGKPCRFDWEIDQKDDGVVNRNISIDPIDLLPSDPFEMDLSTTTAAIAGWMEDLRPDPDDLDIGWKYFWDQSFWFYSESEGVDSDFSEEEGFSELSGYEFQDEELMSVLDAQELLVNSNAADVVDEHCEESSPHDAVLLSLSYLGLQDLLSVKGVCRSLRSAVQNDPLLWRCIHIDSPLSERITDDALFQLTQRAQGSLQCLSLAGCSRITDDGLRQVLESNPKLTMLSIPGCLRLSIDGLINNLKAFKSPDVLGIKHLRLGRLFSVTEEHFEELKLLLGVHQFQQPNVRKPQFYHSSHFSPCCNDERAVDIEMCPQCQKLKLVYDCPLESCQQREAEQCRACEVCIARCIQCGRCLRDCQYMETFFLQYLCSECWKNLPPESREP